MSKQINDKYIWNKMRRNKLDTINKSTSMMIWNNTRNIIVIINDNIDRQIDISTSRITRK